MPKKHALVSCYGSVDSPWIRPDHLRSNDELMRDVLLGLFKTAGLSARVFASAEDFLASEIRHETACLIADVWMPGI
jgi:FixJ family two-component response regulator